MRFAACLLLVNICVLRVEASDTEIAARQTVQQLTRDLMRFEPTHYLRVTRREDLEDDLFAVQMKIKGQLRKAAFFFEITETGFEVVSPDEVLFHSSVDGERRWIAAVDTEGGRAYPLLGFPDAVPEFNALARRANVRISNDTDAQRFSTLYFASALGPTFGQSFRSAADLRCQVAESLGGDERRTEQWMRGVRTGLTYGFDIRRQDSGYLITTTTLKLYADRPAAVQRVTFTIQPAGSATLPSSSTVYAPARSRNTGAVRR
jgi:hypothetical protein